MAALAVVTMEAEGMVWLFMPPIPGPVVPDTEIIPHDVPPRLLLCPRLRLLGRPVLPLEQIAELLTRLTPEDLQVQDEWGCLDRVNPAMVTQLDGA